jgi:hypothetical protein
LDNPGSEVHAREHRDCAAYILEAADGDPCGLDSILKTDDPSPCAGDVPNIVKRLGAVLGLGSKQDDVFASAKRDFRRMRDGWYRQRYGADR